MEGHKQEEDRCRGDGERAAPLLKQKTRIHVYIIHIDVPELAGIYCWQLLPDPLDRDKSGTKKSSGGGFRIVWKGYRLIRKDIPLPPNCAG
jgi:hypothetical protein